MGVSGFVKVFGRGFLRSCLDRLYNYEGFESGFSKEFREGLEKGFGRFQTEVLHDFLVCRPLIHETQGVCQV